MIGKSISHYKILEKLGEGGMGVVYKAEDTKLDRFVALKFLPWHLSQSEEEKKRFIHEAKAASALDHSNICTIYEIDETEDGQMFIAMACYEGESLKEKIERGPLPLDEAMDITIQVANGLAKAHSKDIIHRDIKPANILITEDGQVKIVDFGLAKLAGRTMLTKEGTTLGTVAYMSPEQTQGTEIDHRTDVWALGAVLYEMITGQIPFKGDYEQAVMYSIMNEELEPMTSLRTGVPMELERIVTKALAKSPDERYQHIDEMLVDLKAGRKHLQVGKTKEPPIQTETSKINPVYLYSGLVVLIALLALIGIYFLPRQGETIDSIAVLPLNNLSGDKEQEYFVDGMTEALITQLSKIRSLRVISRTSVMRYKDTNQSLPEIADDLNVDAVVEGSVLKVGNRVLITVKLIEAKADRHLWAQTYDRNLDDILAIYSEVAKKIAEEVKITLTPHEQALLTNTRKVNREAYLLYLKGRYYWFKRSEEGIRKGSEYFQQAIDIDPNFALAYTGVADSWIARGWYSILPPREAYPRTRSAAMKAIEIDDRLAEAHSTLAMVNFEFLKDWAASEREFKRAIELNPNYPIAHHWYGGYLSAMERHDEALAQAKEALELDPLSLIINTWVGLRYYFARQYDKAIEQFKKTIDLDPNFVPVHWHLGWAYEQKAMYSDAITEFQIAVSLSKGHSMYLASLAHANAVAGKSGEARKLLNELNELKNQMYVPAFHVAAIYIGLGEKDRSFEWLEKAYEEGSPWISYLKVEPMLDSLRDDPRFNALLKKVGFK